MTVLEIDSVGVSYGERHVLTAASLRARAGRITALVGRNGAGKTSLLRVGVGLQRANHGIVRFNGRWYPRPSLARFARAGLFYLPAQRILDPFIPLGRQLAAVRDHYAGPELLSLVESLGLTEVVSAAPASLSGGELRRAELALALARKPTCLVADEPFRGIDPRDIEIVMQALQSCATAGAGVVITGHELVPLRQIADAVVWCVAGTTHEFPTAADAWANPQLQQDFLGPAWEASTAP